MPVAPGTLLGRYHIISPLGAGGMGEVYLAQDTQLGRRVAIKFPLVKSDEHHAHARFLREARAVSALSHRNIATIYDYGETEEGQPFLVMELINGESLNDLLHSSSLTLTRAVEIIADVAEALAEAHRHGVIHRDIKPSNVMINDRGEVKVLDFGLAKQLHEEHAGVANPDAQTLLATRTQSGIVVGTPMYLSPEQATSAPVDARSDIFALGTLLYECITGKSAFVGKGIIEITAQIIHVDPPLPSSINQRVPPELDRITLKALAKAPEARYQSADEMLVDLRGVRSIISDEEGHRTQRISPAVKTHHSSALRTLSEMLRRPRVSVGRILLAGLAVGLVVVLLWYISRPTPHEPSAEAKRWYDEGTNAMRDGAYDHASKALLQAIAIDDQYALAHARLAEAWVELDYAEKAKDEILRVTTLVRDRSAIPQLESIYLDAITATATRNFTHAINHYSEIARLMPEPAYVYLDLGRAYEKNDDITKAIENYLEATKRDGQYAAAFLRVGILYVRRQEVPSALAVFEKAEMLYRASSNYEGVAEVLYQRGVLFNRLGNTADAYEQFEKSLESSRMTASLYQQIRALFQLGIISRTQGDTATAEQRVTEALDLARSKGLENLTTQGLINLGNVFYARNDFDEAEKNFRQALDYAQRYNGRLNEARALLSLGSLFIQKDNPDQGLTFVEQALPFFQQGGYRSEISQALSLIGRAQDMKGNYDAAYAALSTQLKIAQDVGDQPQSALLHSDIGTVLARQERYLEALEHFDKSFAITSATRNELERGFNLLNRGDMLWRLGRYKEAKDFIAQAAVLADRPDKKYRQLLYRIAQTNAFLALSERKYGEAMANSKQALFLAVGQSTTTAIEAKYSLGLALGFSGNKQEGQRLCAEAVELAKQTSDPLLLFSAQLGLAEVLLENAKAQEALDYARKTQERFERAGQLESAWRSLVIAGLANAALNNQAAAREDLSRANTHFSTLKQKWGEGYSESYLNRSDIRFYTQKVDKALLALK